MSIDDIKTSDNIAFNGADFYILNPKINDITITAMTINSASSKSDGGSIYFESTDSS